MPLPNLLVIGSMKAGTYSLHNYLHEHPDVYMSQKRKEVNFFIEEMNWRRGPHWYSKFFASESPVRGESSTRYSMSQCFAGVPERAAATVPDAKLIYLVRDPVRRLLSHYVHNVDDSLEHRSFEQVLEAPDRDEYIETGCYWNQLQLWLTHFDEANIKVVCFEDLVNDKAKTMRSVFEFLCVNPDYESTQLAANHNSSADKRRETPAGRVVRKLVGRRALRRNPLLRNCFTKEIPRPLFEFARHRDIVQRYQQQTQQLEDFCGRSFEHWDFSFR